MQITKAVITAAGRGARQYPAFDTVQKAMLPLVDRDGLTKPVLQIIAEEALESGIEEICVVTAPGDEAVYRGHFRNYAAEDLPYPRKRYTDEVHRLLGVMNKRLATRKYLAGAYSIADMACWSWVLSAAKYTDLAEFPHLAAWKDRLGARKAVQRGKAAAAELRKPISEEERKILFGQRAR